jgi:hypothetical protein
LIKCHFELEEPTLWRACWLKGKGKSSAIRWVGNASPTWEHSSK